jgi:hypothetical protein
MEELIGKIRSRLTDGAYINEASVSHGVVTPILRALGWDDTDPAQVVPEYASGRGRVDFALCASARRPSVFVEVKGVGRSVEGDRQLFEYAFHEGVPLCLLTDGRDWSFYLPGGQGSYDDRRVYRLQINERSPTECADVFKRYLSRERVKSGAAYQDALLDYRDASNRREASRALPRAWGELVSEPEELLIELLSERAEKLCGFRPDQKEVLEFLGGLLPKATEVLGGPQRNMNKVQIETSDGFAIQKIKPARASVMSIARQVKYTLFGKSYVAANGNTALVEIFRSLGAQFPDKIESLAQAVRGSTRNHIARTVEEIYPARPDLARAAEFAPGWLVGLNIAN